MDIFTTVNTNINRKIFGAWKYGSVANISNTQAIRTANTQSGNTFLGNDKMTLEDSQLNNDYMQILGHKYHEHRLSILTCLFKAITERILSVTYDLSNTASYRQWMHMHSHNGQPENTFL